MIWGLTATSTIQPANSGLHLDYIWEFNGTIRPDNGSVEFTEDYWFVGYFDSLLHTMVSVVEANADQLLGVINGSLQVIGVWLENAGVCSNSFSHSSENGEVQRV